MQLIKPILLSTALSLCATACALEPASEADEQIGVTGQEVTVITCTDFVFPFFRYNNAAVTDHFYTPNFNELGGGAGGYVLEGTAGKVFTSVFSFCGAVPLYRFYYGPGTDHFYTTSFGEGAGMSFEGVTGYCFPSNPGGLVPLYRYFSPSAFDHFYTTNFGELGGGAAGYRFEGVQCYVAP